MYLFSNPKFDVMSKKKMIYTISILLIAIGIASLIYHGGMRYHIDFTGGLSMEIAPQAVDSQYLSVVQIREALTKNGYPEAEIQEIPRTNSFLIKTKSDADGKTGEKIIEILKTEYPEHVSTDDEGFIRSQEEVGPRAGADLRTKAINSVLIALFFIMIYVWIRYRFTWGFIAAIGLFHDVIITIGVLSLLKIEIGMTVLAALLTVVGYSINNTVVIFDRIRENLKLYRKENDYAIINRSINETLNRTLLMTITTLLVNISLLLFGGPVIKDFALTFMVGTIVGTYSSMCVVTVIVMDTILALKKK